VAQGSDPRPAVGAPRARRAATRRLLLFGRLPEPGRVKTRLIPALGARGAAELYGAFLDDLLSWTPDIAPTELWAPGGERARTALGERCGRATVRLQPAGDLGGRLAAAFDTAFRDGADHVVALGSDHPTLPPAYLERAFAALHGAHLVLGPTSDGGYYALGLRRLCWPRARGLFEGAPWSTPGLLEWTRGRAEALDLCHVELPRWYDVDEPGDLERLARDATPGSATERVWRSLAGRLSGLASTGEEAPGGAAAAGSGP